MPPRRSLPAVAGDAPEAALDGPQASLIDAQTLAHRIVDAPWSVRILDTRPLEQWTESRVPTSESAPRDELETLGLSYSQDTRDLVLVGQDELPGVPLAVQRYPGRVLVLERGFEGWRRYALDGPAAPLQSTPEELARYQFQSEVHQLVTGQASAPPPPAVIRSAAPRPAGGSGGCN